MWILGGWVLVVNLELTDLIDLNAESVLIGDKFEIRVVDHGNWMIQIENMLDLG